VTRPALPPGPAIDGEIVERLNTHWRLADPAAVRPSLKHRLLHPVRRAVARLIGPQETFNATVVQFVNAAMTLQQQQREHLQLVLDSVHAALDTTRADAAAVMDELVRHREALAARERRIEAALGVIRAEHDELRTAISTVQHLTHGLVRDVAALRASGPAAGVATDHAPAAGAPAPATSSDALTHKYVGFEDQFRGSPEAIRAGLAEYVPIFAGASDVLDVGCGRGEFLALLRESGITARGIDLNDAMVEVCRGKGLEASRADAFEYLRAQPDGSLGGLLAAQVVEHLEPWYLAQLLDAAFEKLRPGAPIVLETINPACWFAFFESYIRDITHVRPLHPDTLKFLMVATGFQRLEIRYRAPYPEHEKLQVIPSTPAMGDSVETLNANVEKINRMLFTYLDYAAVGRRP
jgi:O-antigen chain-terminating methyltransferase